ncbi:MAG: ribonuclease J [Candidatus Terrybacteria bacterium CG10_big_fil_rev_8_21_14_0_10_41_10]|uniref:Ribonuclease J n=1 Tax=Candidatus Terrybacteria bacterium CG10_big_fil_rev_8_21_14_0_10_41_10 TaxID=1975026 RepID=A0A2M8LAC6_9BACT|nr:MAG: ribonuclease J [Candidatus Terrybacteria bacterium CG10_big_fil_rev_8_21_14_0_10_41_10]
MTEKTLKTPPPITRPIRRNASAKTESIRRPARFGGIRKVVSQYKAKQSPALFDSSKRPNKVRVIPLGGVEEIGRNMTLVEYGNDILIVDAGIQFPEEETPGIDFIIPNTAYLEKNKHRIRGIIISHGHMDHIGAIPYIIDKVGYPTIYTTGFSRATILRRQEEFTHMKKINVEEINPKSVLSLGQFKIKFFETTHTIPDAIGTIIETPLGNIIYPGDFKFEINDNGKPMHYEQYEALGKENNLVLLMESTNAETPGFSVPESVVRKNLEEFIKNAKDRVIIGMFASLVERAMEVVNIAEKYDKKVVIDGYSLKNNFELVKEFGYFKPKKDTMITPEEAEKYPPSKIIAILTGSQGEKNAALMRVANKKHKYIKLQKTDTVILSSSVIPGNEKSIQNLKDNIARQGAKIIHYRVAGVHASGHACQEDLKLMLKFIKPKYLIPVHGHYFMLKINSDLAESVGMPKENIAVPMNNGVIIEMDKDKIETLKESVPANYVMVDGLGVGDVKEVVLRDRQMLSQDGIFVMITVIDSQTGQVRNSPDIISRGFVYLKESQELLRSTRQLIRKTVEEATGKMHPINMDFVKEMLREKIGKFLFQKTKRRPMVLPVIIEV